jgi:hypothetical protein
LAVAYAASGRFTEAVNAAEKALALARFSGRQRLAREINRRLLLFKADQPYIEGNS